MTGFTYPEVGATAAGPLPPGYHHLRHRTLLGHGRDVLEAAGEAVLTWRMHRAAGAGVRAQAGRAAPGVTVEVSLGVGPLRLTAPCRVVWTVGEPDRIGFAYGTLDGHPEQGEESFVVRMGDDKAVWFAVTAFSRPARWFSRAAGPAVPVAQKLYARRCGQVLRRLSVSGTHQLRRS
ncbi:DUF1990 family protein [Peterkaempfera bronchialis]|uniref:DUF1990 domain-containing protein n=1 Tax=Peterkaempfera bronchialis TaxID=2126346 RepID=A0A345SRS5_9ACTN|nr:DUF1990 domain-containing protein [Peterkaempfera bronchialis]AXI76430.1 DUF1990 domain-containing protein [Peterkaempfera bronchialis]